MEGLLSTLDNLFRPINEMMRSTDRAQVIRLVAIYLLVAGIFSLCGGLALVGVGGLAGIGGIVGGVGLQLSNVEGVSQEDLQQANEALSQLGSISGFVVILGILSLIAAPLLIVAAAGLFQRAKWARNLAVIAFLVNALSSLLSLFTGGGILNIIWVVVSAYLAYFFYRDEGLKAQFG
jgi:hypothetical protein